jgi:hypothetical protein
MEKTLCIGYHWVCGDRVEVARVLQGSDVPSQLPASVTVTCSQGHVAAVTADQFAALEHWELDLEPHS